MTARKSAEIKSFKDSPVYQEIQGTRQRQLGELIDELVYGKSPDGLEAYFTYNETLKAKIRGLKFMENEVLGMSEEYEERMRILRENDNRFFRTEPKDESDYNR